MGSSNSRPALKFSKYSTSTVESKLRLLVFDTPVLATRVNKGFLNEQYFEAKYSAKTLNWCRTLDWWIVEFSYVDFCNMYTILKFNKNN